MSFGKIQFTKKSSDGKSLTKNQKDFFALVERGENIFLTGPAGCGKSYCLEKLIEDAKNSRINVGKTAATGVAAFNIGGQTLHSYCGIGLGDDHISLLIERVKSNKKVLNRLKYTKILIIDEVSMIKSELLEKIDLIFKAVKINGHAKPFGGVQVILVGDHLQLEPVWKGDEIKDYAFNSKVWRELNLKNCYLSEPIRQHKDSPFAKCLLKIRVGDLSDLKIIKSRIDAKFPKDGIEAVKILCKNIDVDGFNQEKLSKIKSPAKIFLSKDDGQEYHIQAFNRNCPAPQRLELKVGAQVMLLKNLDVFRGLVNGSIGVVESFTTEGPVVKFATESEIVSESSWEIKEQVALESGIMANKIVARRTQIPLRVCYAVSVHKCQGATLDRAEIDLNEAFSAGQAYTALSRVRNLESLSIVDFPEDRIIVSKECLDFYKKLEKESKVNKVEEKLEKEKDLF